MVGVKALADACTTTLDSSNVTYGNTNVQDAIDDLYGATENKGKTWISITKVWGIKNLD